jgi:hypothetical protein
MSFIADTVIHRLFRWLENRKDSLLVSQRALILQLQSKYIILKKGSMHAHTHTHHTVTCIF